MNHVRNVSLACLAIALAIGCGGSEKTEPQVPEATPPAPTAPPESAAKGPDTTPPGDSAAMGSAAPAGQPGAAGAASEPAPAAPPAEALSDEQILQITHVANTGEVAMAKLAKDKAKDPAVKKFAAMMIKDHGDADAKGTEIAKKNKLTPADSPTSTSLKADGDKTSEQLKGQRGAEFDRAYMDAQVKGHQTVLDSIDKQLLPNAKNADIKAMLNEVRPKVEAHLKMAQDIQKSLPAK